MQPSGPSVPALRLKPPRIARLRLVLGYAVMIAAFWVNHGKLEWWALSIIALGSLIRIWSAGSLVKIAELSTDGPYALSRNPLYLGSFIGGVGLALFVHSWPLLVFFVAAFGLCYSVQIAWEEKLLAGQHGKSFHDYCSQVPRFFPVRWSRAALQTHFSFQRVVTNCELGYQALWLVMILGLITQAYLKKMGIGFSLP